MSAAERDLAEAAAGLSVDDFRYLEGHGMLPAPGHSSKDNTPVTVTQEESPDTHSTGKKKRSRRSVSHPWPDVGTILEADYEGVHYEAEVVEAPRFKNGKALRLLTGPAAGQIFRSPTGAMLKATERQREENGLGRKGVANGWGFWTPREGNGDGKG